MKTPRSLTAIVEEQCLKWNARSPVHATPAPPRCQVITLSREPGTRARIVARALGERLGWDVYGSNIVDAVAKSARCSEVVVRSLDERGRSFVEDLVSSLGSGLTSDEYLHHLALIVATLARHGRAVILGRGASFLLPRGTALRVRFVAPLEMRVRSFTKEFDLPAAEARRRLKAIEAQRRRFISDAFGKDVADPREYDLVINEEWISAAAATDMILVALKAVNG